MLAFENITNDILRLKVPFENIYTAVFLIKTEDGDILVDAAATKYDAEEVILPALMECTDICRIKYLFCTHLHGDHGGGIRHLLPHLRCARVASASARAIELYGEKNALTVHDGDKLLGIKAILLKGHSHDSMGLFDARSKTAIVGDAVQLCGITKYGTGVELPAEYRKTLELLRNMDIDRLVASHEYHSLGSYAQGEAVKAYIDEAEKNFNDVARFVYSSAENDPVAIAAAYTAAAREKDFAMPSLQSYTVRALLREKGE